MPSTQTIFPALTKDDFLAQERECVPKRITMTMMSANVLRWLGGLSTIPNEMLEAGRAVLVGPSKTARFVTIASMLSVVIS
jgi:hypothetical protein